MTRTILIVEDYDDAREMLVLLLEGRGFRTVTARNGVEALDQARREQPQLILMDLFMPVMDGIEASRRLRNDPLLKNIPIIAQTAAASEAHDHSRLFSRTLIKPCTPELLFDSVDELLAAAAN